MTEDKIRSDLLPDIRETVLNIRYQDATTDNEIVNYIADGMRYLTSICPPGTTLDFLARTEERRLLDNYVLYARSRALDDFRDNYAQDLREFRHEKEVIHHATESATP